MSDPIFASAVTNPFQLTNTGIFISQTFVDIDGDGDLDVFVGNYDGNTLFFRNTGTNLAPAFAPVETNPFGFTDVGFVGAPTFVDINGDHKIDAFVGNRDGNLVYFQNTGTGTVPAFAPAVTNPFGFTDIGSNSNPTFVDIDGDGDLDAFVGTRYGTVFFKNTGNYNTPGFAAASGTPFGLTNIGTYTTPSFVDVDGNGTLDAVIGNKENTVLLYRNTGTTTAPAFAAPVTNPFGITPVGAFLKPTLVDINGDGNLDAFVGNLNGNILFFNNIRPPEIATSRYDLNTGILIVIGTGFLALAGVNNDINVSKLTITGEGGTSYTLTSANVEIDSPKSFTVTLNPADKAALNSIINKQGSQSSGGTTYNLAAAEDWAAGAAPAVIVADLTGNGIAAIIDPVFAAPLTNPFGLIDVGTSGKPIFVDIDGDGKLDAFVGNSDGNTLFFKNTGTTIAPFFAAPLTNPFGLIAVGISSAPTFVDIDGDGKLDALIGNRLGNTLFFKNTGTTIAPFFAAPLTNPFGLIYAGGSSAPTFVDIDGDGKLDALIGNRFGDTLLFKNTGTTTDPSFAAPVPNPFGITKVILDAKPAAIDIDGDGKFDLLVGSRGGNTMLFRNTGTTTAPAFAPAVTNPFGLIAVGASSNPTFVDINGDGNLDAFVGNDAGNTLFFNNTLPPVTTVTTRTDFNGDKKSDILWRNDNGNIALWQMNGSYVVSSNLTSTPNLPGSWKTAGTGDFNGDGKSDILWRNDNGSIALWQINGATVVSSSLASTANLPSSWKTAGTGDFNGDGKSDILWRNDNGSIALWQMNGATVVSSNLTSTPSLDTSWKVAGTGDFNGDGKYDILWRNDDGSVALWQMNGAAVTASTAVSMVSNDWKINGTGDFNGDGKSDILWRNDNGSVALWQMNGASIVSSSFTSTPSVDNSWKITGTGDFNGDGKSDILWRNDSGVTSVWTMNGANVLSSSLTSALAIDPTWKIAAPLL